MLMILQTEQELYILDTDCNFILFCQVDPLNDSFYSEFV